MSSALAETSALAEILKSRWPGLESARSERLLRYYELLVDESSRQNLTRLISPEDFYSGHCEDVRALEKSGLIEFPAMDMGSGAGVPGLLAAVVFGGEWLLCDSEKMKAAFLQRVVDTLEMKGVRVEAKRAEDILKSERVGSVTARAVGTVEKIHNWIRGCSTWNNLVLFKGPGWVEEWKNFLSSPRRNDLKLDRSHEYTVGADAKRRVLVRLIRKRSRN